MKTLKEQIAESTRFYILHLNPKTKGHLDRYSIYRDTPQGLEVLWPSHEDMKDGGHETLLPSQKYSLRDQYPAYHFVLNGGNYSKPYDLHLELAKYKGVKENEIEVFTINGHSPSRAGY